MPSILIEKQSQTSVSSRSTARSAVMPLTVELMNEFISALRVTSDKASERVLIVRGAGASFCAGLDLKAATPQNAHATAEMVAKMLAALSQTRLITIAAVHGAAVAGGAGTCRHATTSLPLNAQRLDIRSHAAGSCARTGHDLSPPTGPRTRHPGASFQRGNYRRTTRLGDRFGQSRCPTGYRYGRGAKICRPGFVRRSGGNRPDQADDRRAFGRRRCKKTSISR